MISEKIRNVSAEINILSTITLNDEQQEAFDTILRKVFNEESGMFFIDVLGGTGKTYLYKALLAAVRSKNLIALATASSEVAVALLPGGRTAHSRFKIPLEITNDTGCSISKQSALANFLRMAKLIIWDEAPMVHRFAVEALDKMLRDINECNIPFGGKVIVLGGDFRQILPVVQKGARCSWSWIPNKMPNSRWKRLGIRSLVLESSDHLRITGFALTMCTNAWRILDALGIEDLSQDKVCTNSWVWLQINRS
ncbi:ATP-dependent DNA helicase [Abeliophyllum distichum]|uniref:ATP-dependent DNA helicase n=1 Tax=Abeliophyllum distichum TaxID=126358 RepID=A0ABD1W2N4_9LAMI